MIIDRNSADAEVFFAKSNEKMYAEQSKGIKKFWMQEKYAKQSKAIFLKKN